MGWGYPAARPFHVRRAARPRSRLGAPPPDPPAGHTHDTPLRLRNPVGNGLPCTYIACTDPPLASIAPSHRWVRDRPGWAWLEIATGHDAMVTAPAELTRQLAAIP